MRRIIAVIDEDKGYSLRLSGYFNTHDLGGLKSATYTDVAAFRASASEYDVQMTLLSENAAAELREDDKAGIKIILSEDGLCRERPGFFSIFKYSRADDIIREIMRIYSDNTENEFVKACSKKSRLFAVVSPVGRCGKTSFSLALSAVLSEGTGEVNSRTLFISLDDYNGVFRVIAGEALYDLSDIIYAFCRNRFSWSKLRQSAYRFGAFDYIAPARYAEDLSVLNQSQICELILKISSESEYENIVIDVGACSMISFELLEVCDRIYMPVLGDRISRMKIEEFEEITGISGHGDLLKKIRKLELPLIEDGENEAIYEWEGYANGKLYEFAGSVQRDTEKPE